MRILGYLGGLGGPKIWKQSDKEFLSYRENDEVSADADADVDADTA